jgi:hypothetical protein
MFCLLKFWNAATPIRWLQLASLVLVAGICVSPARAGEIHAGDIELEIEGGKLVTHNGRYFESEFATLISGTPAVYRSTSPGFDSAAGLLGADEEIGFNVLGPLLFWNGTAMAAPQAGLGLSLFWAGNSRSVTGTSGSVTNGFSLGGATALDGSFHEHFTFEIAENADLGAYGVLLELTPAGSSTFTNSDPFLLVFNRGLGAEEFEAGVGAMVQMTAVPEPSALALAGIGLLAMGGVAWRRRLNRFGQNA